MNNELNGINRFLLIAVVIISASVSFASFKTFGTGTLADVKGVSNTQTRYHGDVGDVSVEIVSSNPGTFTLFLDFAEPISIAGAELYFELGGDLQILNLECTTTLTCLNATYDDNTLVIRALRAPDLANTPLVDRVKIAEVSYIPNSSGSLKINSSILKESIVYESGQATNLVRYEEILFIVK